MSPEAVPAQFVGLNLKRRHVNYEDEVKIGSRVLIKTRAPWTPGPEEWVLVKVFSISPECYINGVRRAMLFSGYAEPGSEHEGSVYSFSATEFEGLEVEEPDVL